MSTSKIKNRLVIKEMNKEEHLSQFNNLLRYAFQVTNRELLDVGWEEDEIKQSKSPVLEKADVIGWFDGDKLASQIAVYPMKVNIHGEIYEMGGVTGVATYPEYANMGLMHTLIKRSLIEMRRRGQTVSFLFPYSIPYYRRKGWEIISDKMTFTIKDTKKPTVSGVKNGKTYIGAKVVKFKDNCGIAKATLNGKKISSGKKISKKGSYKLVVTDINGLKTIVSFKIK